MKPIRNLLAGMAFAGILAIGLHLLHAQETTASNPNYLTAQQVNSMSDMQVLLQAVELMPTTPATNVPRTGTFYSAQHAPGSSQPWPPMPTDARQVPLWDLGNGIYLMADQNVDYSIPPISTLELIASGMMTMDSGGGMYPDGSTNIAVPALNPIADNGTNLWLAQVDLASNSFSGIVSNSFADIQYELQYKTDLAQTNWQSANWFVYGSELTNWTPFSVPAVSSSNLFLRARSWQDDGSGLPIWWQFQYFGTNGVDPYGDPAGDGWNNLQKFQNGMDPNVFYTPPAPQGVTVAYNPVTGNLTVNWLPSPGPVTGYTVNDSDGIFTVSANSLSFQGNVPVEDLYSDPVSGGPQVWGYVKVQANYAGGDSAWSDPAYLEAPNPSRTTILPAYMIEGPQSSIYLVASPQILPPGTSAVRLTRIDFEAESYFGDSSFDTNWDISISNFTNGLYLLPTSMAAAPVDAYGVSDYVWWVQTVSANGTLSSAELVNQAWTASQNNSGRALPPFFDGRTQLKQNLIFALRAASENQPFRFYEQSTNDFYPATTYPGSPRYYYYNFGYPADYVWQSINQADYTGYFAPYVFSPFDDNYRYLNFVFNPAETASDGHLTTGVTIAGQYPNYYVELLNPAYQFNGSAGQITNSFLPASQTRWLYSEWEADQGDVVTQNYPNYSMAANARNLYGLPYLSVELAYPTSSGLAVTTLSAGGNVTLSSAIGTPVIYLETAQPQFQTMEYDFWQRSPLPGSSGFAATNTSDVLVAPVGVPTMVNGYAKLAVLNGYSGVYGYLGQYLVTNAYQIDANNNVTTNTTGVLSPYGNFFATEPGPAALVTMPDIDTGEQGTGVVYCVSLNVDKNHDGVMDTTFAGPDTTSASFPYIFWRNNNFDRWKTTANPLYTETEQDDVQPGTTGDQNLDPNNPDCNYKVNGYRAIPDTRDLEDFARLWICGFSTNLLAALPSNSTVTLSWGDVGNPNTSNPTIDLFQAADADGGIGYLTNETIATAQLVPYQGGYVGRLGPGDSIQLNANYFGSTWRGDHFIWCGVSNGTGGLTLTIADGNGNVLAQTMTYIQIKDIKDMYERWTVGDNPNETPLTIATNACNDLPDPMQSPFQYLPSTDTNTPYILFVHGYNLAIWEKDRFAETAFKRLYWQGYQGRFGSFRWPTANVAAEFDRSEWQAWRSGLGLYGLLAKLNTEYPGSVYLLAHSMGNTTAGEALKEGGTNYVVNTYIAAQAAIPSHCYDPTTPTVSLSNDSGTPDRHAHYWTDTSTNYFAGIAGAANYINFYNTNDWALTFAWPIDQNAKPTIGALLGYSFNAPDTYYENYHAAEIYFPGDTYEIYSQIIQGRCNELGAQPDVKGPFWENGAVQQINLGQSPFDYGNTHVYHSAEFRSDDAHRWQFWNEVLLKMRLKIQ